MKNQEWLCDKCKKKSKVSYRKGENFLSVISKIIENHQKISPLCNQLSALLRAPNLQYRFRKRNQFCKINMI